MFEATIYYDNLSKDEQIVLSKYYGEWGPSNLHAFGELTVRVVESCLAVSIYALENTDVIKTIEERSCIPKFAHYWALKDNMENVSFVDQFEG